MPAPILAELLGIPDTTAANSPHATGPATSPTAHTDPELAPTRIQPLRQHSPI
jgi:hypothetical protein